MMFWEQMPDASFGKMDQMTNPEQTPDTSFEKKDQMTNPEQTPDTSFEKKGQMTDPEHIPKSSFKKIQNFFGISRIFFKNFWKKISWKNNLHFFYIFSKIFFGENVWEHWCCNFSSFKTFPGNFAAIFQQFWTSFLAFFKDFLCFRWPMNDHKSLMMFLEQTPFTSFGQRSKWRFGNKLPIHHLVKGPNDVLETNFRFVIWYKGHNDILGVREHL